MTNSERRSLVMHLTSYRIRCVVELALIVLIVLMYMYARTGSQSLSDAAQGAVVKFMMSSQEWIQGSDAAGMDKAKQMLRSENLHEIQTLMNDLMQEIRLVYFDSSGGVYYYKYEGRVLDIDTYEEFRIHPVYLVWPERSVDGKRELAHAAEQVARAISAIELKERILMLLVVCCVIFVFDALFYALFNAKRIGRTFWGLFQGSSRFYR